MTNLPKIAGKFYPLQNLEWVELSQKLNHSELRVLYYLRTLDPFGEKFKEASTKAIATSLQISQRTVQRAVLKLAELELIDLEITRFNFRVRSQHAIHQAVNTTVGNGIAVPTSALSSDVDVASATSTSLERHPCRNGDTNVAAASPKSRPKPEKLMADKSYDLKTNKTYSDFLKTLSESEREKFMAFCQRKANEMPEKVVLVESWSAAHFEELLGMYWQVYSRERTDVLPGKQGDIDRASYGNGQRVVEEQIAQGLQDGRIKKLDPTFDGLWDKEGNWWRQGDWVEKETKNTDTSEGVEINSSIQEE
ncbi:MAG: helix-turn-helix domain-containing protein [Cyanosarcina radialis HA8281-LM2]|jgi:hypothetical protein|nr:helix-turn-helix domain-containing protein [Cyanosarcina radialis HA8281-LM2]